MHILQFRTVYADTDKMGVMYHGNYARYLEIARVEYIRSLGISYAEIEQQGVMLPVIEWHAQFLRPAVYDEILTIKTTLKEIVHQSKIMFISEVYNEKNKCILKAEVTLCYMDTNTKKAIKAPTWLQEKIAKNFI
ncbi:MAG: acyl-CoA thioesterase [Chitinophagaceae bacterium]